MGNVSRLYRIVVSESSAFKLPYNERLAEIYRADNFEKVTDSFGCVVLPTEISLKFLGSRESISSC